MAAFEFKLRVGMRDLDVLRELKGKVSGETKQETVKLLAPSVGSEMAHFEILQATEEYAILRKWIGEPKPFVEEYYLSGISDEGKYFMRQLSAEAITKPMDELLQWINRNDELFAIRIQGDVLLQFRSCGNRRINTPIIGSWSPLSTRLDEELRLLENNANFQARARIPFPVVLNQGLIRAEYNLPSYNLTSFDLREHHIEANLGNHHVTVNGWLFINLPYVVLDGDSFTMQHFEHGLKTIEVPKGHYAILASQRGRTLNASIIASTNIQSSMPSIAGVFD